MFLGLSLFMVSKFLRALHAMLLVCSLTVGLTVAPIAHALKVRVNAQMRIRTMQGQQLNHAGVLAPGSIIDIPDKYVIMDSAGRVNNEMTLNNWLRNAGYEQRDIDGRGNGERNDFFFPVRVASGAAMSGQVNPGSVYYVSLRTLARDRGVLVTTGAADFYDGPADDAPLMSTERPQPSTLFNDDVADEAVEDVPPPPPPPPQETAPAPGRSAEVAPSAPAIPRFEAAPPCTNCFTPGSGGAITSLRAMVQPALNRVASQYEANRRRTTQLDTVGATFRASCGIAMKDFLPEIGRAARANNVPPSMLLSLMSQESMGDCYLRPGTNSTYKGLFQIALNSKSRNVSVCSPAQKAQLLAARSLAGLRAGPQCLENPVVNANEAARILRAKVDFIMTRVGRTGFTRADGHNNGLTANAWRLAAAGYNGGEGHVVEAHQNMMDFNRVHGTRYQVTNWEDMKVFFLRGYLDDDRQTQQYGRPERQRAWTRTVLNLGYAENIIPTGAGVAGRETSIEAWSRWVRANQTR